MKDLHVTYRIECDASEVDARAQAIAVEQSIEMPPAAVRSQRVRDEVIGEVTAIEPIEPSAYRVTIGLSLATTGLDAGQLLNMLFGNTSLQAEVSLLDFEADPDALCGFGGPRFGIEGLRELVGAVERPLTCSALKPQGLAPAELAALAGELARGGVDIIKDDHGLANQDFSPFAERVPAVQAAVAKANRDTGGNTLYVPSLTGGPEAVRARWQLARDEGVEMMMLAPMISGLSTLQYLASLPRSVPILAHPAMAGAARIAPQTLIGRLFRLCGADAVIFPNHGGRFSYSPACCKALAEAARQPWGRFKPAMPVPAGGMTPARVGEMVDFYGSDVMLLIGGALLGAAEGVEVAARSFSLGVKATGS